MNGPELKKICEEWELKYRYGTTAQRKARAALWELYYTFVYSKQSGAPYSLPDEDSPAVKKLVSEGILNKNGTVLDVGCGTGSHALQMARHCGKVFAIDGNAAALRVLNKRCELNCVKNVETRQVMWEDYEPSEKFDLAFSSMCPAVCNLDELLRFEGVSSGYCALMTVMSGSREKYRYMMMRELDIAPAGMITECGIYLDVLERLGRDVGLFTQSYHSERLISKDELLEMYPVYFKVFGIGEDRSVPYLTDFFDRHQEDGYLHDEAQINTALLYWKAGD